MTYNIVAIRTKYSFSDTADDIIAVKLDFDYVESVSDVVLSIDYGSTYYYTDNLGIKSEVESVHPQHGAPYIRTKANYTTKDNLFSLPRFQLYWSPFEEAFFITKSYSCKSS